MSQQINAKTKMPYQGRNQSDLLEAKNTYGYTSDEWLTFLQAKEIGLSIKKGSKSVAVFKGFGETKEIKEDGKVTRGSAPLGFARVFNLDCTEKYEQETISRH